MKNDKRYCCNGEATWVDNVPGKEYWYCRSCKNEVIAPSELIEVTQFVEIPTILAPSKLLVNASIFCDLPDCPVCKVSDHGKGVF